MEVAPTSIKPASHRNGNLYPAFGAVLLSSCCRPARGRQPVEHV